jgi:hypothetical protein
MTRPRYRLGLAAFLMLAAAMVVGGGSALAGPVSGAVSTTDNPGFVDANNPLGVDGACLNGPPHTTPQVNCNIYQDKTDVWLSGLPVQSSLGAGTYFFAVLDPGSQNPGPNDGSAGNLSSPFDAWTNREFTVDGSGNITSYTGTHNRSGSALDPTDRTGNMLQLFPYADTSNPGGVYILAVCEVPQAPSDSPGVNPSDCKYDAFKVNNSQTVPGAVGPTITKGAAGVFATTYKWDISKSVDKTVVKQIGGNATFTYTVHVTHDAGTVGSIQVTGTITVFNPNADTMTGVVTDQLSDGTVCSVTGGGTTLNPASLVSGNNDFAYTCDIVGTTVPSSIDNTATVTWGDQDLSDGHLVGGSAPFTFTGVSFTGTNVDNCTTVTDPVPTGGTSIDNPFPATVCVGDAGPPADGGAGTGTTDGFTFVYHTTYPVLAGCKNYTNTATESTDGEFSSVVVTVCGPLNTSALTIGFWKNTNGQALIGTYCAPASPKPSLAAYLSSLSPFADAAGKNCSQLQTYVTSILKGATATNMNVMLRAQMLSTALDVYFSDPTMGYTTTSKSGKKPPSTFLTHGALGGVSIDTTAICPMVDNSTTGTATCKNNTPSTDGFASLAFPAACMTVQGILTYESGNPPFNGSTTSPVWYGGSKTLEEIAKNTYDQINNQDAFGC